MTDDRSLPERLRRIQLLICDVDGVLTDGTIYRGPGEWEFKRFSVVDGAGFYLARAAGLKTALISGRYSPATDSRAQELAVDAVHNGAADKLLPYAALKKQFALRDEQIAYVGDDVIDLPVMELVGLPVAVRNAHPLVKERAGYITEKNGGEGAIREVIDLILQARGLLAPTIKKLQSN